MITLTGLTTEQQHIANLIWGCETKDEIDQLKTNLPALATTIELIVTLMQLEFLDTELQTNPDFTVANKFIDRIMNQQ